MNLYETCISTQIYNDTMSAIEFSYRVEKQWWSDKSAMDAKKLMHAVVTEQMHEQGQDTSAIAAVIQKVEDCYQANALTLDSSAAAGSTNLIVQNAKKTPPHPGVPYVMVDGKQVADITKLAAAVCDACKARKTLKCPSDCDTQSLATSMTTSVEFEPAALERNAEQTIAVAKANAPNLDLTSSVVFV